MSQLVQQLIEKGLLTPESSTKPVANVLPVKANDYLALLTKFPEQYRDKLRAYTGEELFYLYKICIYKPRLDEDGKLRNSSDGLILSLKAKCFKWLKGELRSGVNVSILNRVGRKFRNEFFNMVVDSITQDMIDSLAKQVNNRRIERVG